MNNPDGTSKSVVRHLPLPWLGAAAVTLAAVVGIAGCRTQPAADPVVSAARSDARLVSFNGQTGIELPEDSLKLAGVTTVVTGTQDLHQKIQPTGEVAATDAGTVQVTPRLPGRIAQALVSVGTQVHAGQLIAEVDSVDLTQAELTYKTAVAHMQLTKNQLAQQRKLVQYGTISEPPVEDAQQTFSAAQAAVASDEEQIKVDKTALANTKQLVNMGEITHKPVEDAQNAHAQAVAALTQAKVQLTSAQQNLNRTKSLYKVGIYSTQQLEDAETAYNGAVAAVDQNTTQEKLTADELHRQETIYKQNLNGAASLQDAQSKLQQDQHTYEHDLTALSVARTQLDRAHTVKKSGIPSSQALQQAEDAYDEAKAAVDAAADTLRLYGVSPAQGMAQLQKGHAVIPVVAPMKGIVTQRNMVVGQMADTGTALATIVNLDRVYVDARVYEKDIAAVAVGDEVQLSVAAYPQKTFAGIVKYIGNAVNADTRTITVRTVIANPGWLLRPGMFATILIHGKQAEQALTVPSDAVLQEGTQQVVYVQVAPHEFARRVVNTGAAVDGLLPVRSGLRAGDRVVVTGNLLIEQEEQKLEGEKRGRA